MSYIITDDKHYKNIANAIRGKLSTDTQYHPEDMSIAINNIPSSADGTDDPVVGIYFTNPDKDGYPTKAKIVGWRLDNKETAFPIVFTDLKFKRLQTIEFLDCDFKLFQNYICQGLLSLTSIKLPDTLMSIGTSAFYQCPNLTSINFPNTLTSIDSSAFQNCRGLVDVTLANGFNCNNLDLSSSTKFTRETIVSWLNALADRTGLTAYKLTIGATNLAKLTEEDILIATNKNWTLA